MAILLSLCAALTYGLSDFVGGLLSRRSSPWVIAFTSQVGGAVLVLLAGLILGGSPDGSDLGWAAVAGVGNGVGTSFLYRGLSGGRMGVVAPVSGVGAAVVPVVVGVATGERPGLLAWTGIVAALPAIYLVAREPAAGPGAAGRRGAGLADGVLAGLGFGTLFAALAQIPDDAGLVPLAFNQAVGAVVVAIVATLVGAAWLPREARAWSGLVCGALGGTATALFLVATHHGFLTVSAVLTALYPAGTVALAAVALHERVHRHQGLGLVLCAAAVTLIALA